MESCIATVTVSSIKYECKLQSLHMHPSGFVPEIRFFILQ